MSRKIKIMISVVCTLWIVVFAQIILTKAYVKRNDMTQAFARNQLAIAAQSGELPEICQEGGWVMGKLPGKLSTEEKKRSENNRRLYCLSGKVIYCIAYG